MGTKEASYVKKGKEQLEQLLLLQKDYQEIQIIYCTGTDSMQLHPFYYNYDEGYV